MTHDRVAKNDIALTHDVIADVLGIRRAGVSVALEDLQEVGLIAIGRGHLVVLDRQGLRDVAGDFYGAPEKALERLIKK
jgi:hypothetical protein